MSVPLERLYNFLHDVCDHRDLIIYRFYPHGSKKITDLRPMVSQQLAHHKNWATPDRNPLSKRYVFMHDQEPLNFDLYSGPDLVDDLLNDPVPANNLFQCMDEYITKLYKELIPRIMPELNIKLVTGGGLWKMPALLVHSEQRSKNLQKYKDIDFIGIYWWCHALIARDWFRYAQHDITLDNRTPQTDFLIYNRAWSGTREYRLKFAELLIDNQLTDHCAMGFNSEDHGDYRQHRFQNTILQIQRQDLENYFFYNDTASTASADYNSIDYQNTELEVVLETLFDDDRLQLTEKILRPIACGHPFVLLSTVGSLEYLRQYGFKTFDSLIDETYDTIQDPVARLNAVILELKRIAGLELSDKQKLYSSMREIAQYNKKLFFSEEWQKLIVDEYCQNFKAAMLEYDQRYTPLINQF